MYKFKVLASIVEAVQINKSGEVIINGKKYLGDAGSWVVIDHHGDQSTWSNEEFRKNFEPYDALAANYLNGIKSPGT